MEKPLNQEQVIRLSKFLQVSGRTSTSYKRQALLYEIGYDPNKIEIHSGAGTDFSFMLIGHLNEKGDRKMLRRIASAIMSYLGDKGKRELLEIQSYLVEEQKSNIAEVEIDKLENNPPLFPTSPEKAETTSVSLIVLSVLIATISGLTSNIIASYIQEQYQIFTNNWRLVTVAVVFVFSLAASIWLALRREKRTIEITKGK
jgi:hypothetical protein